MRTTHLYLAAAGTAAAIVCVIVHWRSSRKQRRSIQTVLSEAEKSVAYTESSPVYGMLVRAKAYETPNLSVQYFLPEGLPLESLFTRIIQKDVAKGIIDPEQLGTDACCDIASVHVRLEANTWRELRLPIFMAHLANPLGLCDAEAEDPSVPLWADGSWTGTLLWDSAALVCEIFLASPSWRARLRGASCVELGAGLGLPGLVGSLLGATPVLLTDRQDVALLAEAGCRANRLDGAVGVELDWEEGAARQMLKDHLDGQAPSIILACDCIFAPLFGESHLLLQMLSVLAGPQTTIVLALERRPDDGAESFFTLAHAAGFETVLLQQRNRVVVCEMWRREAGNGPVGVPAY
mmetsp:Transcript_15143/g.39100  ORF Transcript_15143/g.39100 Transcript_15143/m.39100 type:complete len:350 (-) Transcript_15143:215-1264(-)